MKRPLSGRKPQKIWGRRDPQVSGGDLEEATPDPIPNSEVKLLGADGTAREAVWESRTLPGFFCGRGACRRAFGRRRAEARGRSARFVGSVLGSQAGETGCACGG